MCVKYCKTTAMGYYFVRILINLSYLYLVWKRVMGFYSSVLKK